MRWIDPQRADALASISMKQTGKTVVLSGGGSGIGEATAHQFAEHGYHVVLLGRRLRELERVKGALPSAEAVECDITNERHLQKLVKKIEGLSFQDLTLVNNAGIFRRHPFLEDHLGNWKEQFEVNLFGAVRLTQLLVPLMLPKKSGSIVNVSSTLGLQVSQNVSAYSASKAAMNSWTQSLALELAPSGIRVNAICPGLVDTPIHEFHFQNPTEKAKTLKKMGPIQPLGRVGTAKEIARSIYFLASADSSWTTGAILSVDGGIFLT